MKILQILFFSLATTFSTYAQVQKDDLPVPPPAAENEEQEKALTVAEQMPEFEGGQQALMSFISKNMIYPQSAIDDEIEGRVFVNFVVTSDGTLKDIAVLRGVQGGEALHKEAIRVVKLTDGKWKPGSQKGKPVNVKFTLPITFKLQ